MFFQGTKHSAELDLSNHLPICIESDPFPDFSLDFFHELKEKFFFCCYLPARQVATEEPAKFYGALALRNFHSPVNSYNTRLERFVS